MMNVLMDCWVGFISVGVGFFSEFVLSFGFFEIF